MKIDMSDIIAGQLAKCGRTCTITKADGTVETVGAVIQQVWRRLKSKFESTTTGLGGTYTDYYLYYGPADCDITRLTQADIFESDGKKFYFVRSDRVLVGDTVQFYSGVLKLIYEGDSDVFG